MNFDNNDNTQTKSLDIFRILRNKFSIILLIFTISVIIAVVLANTLEKKFSSRAELEIKMPNDGLTVFNGTNDRIIASRNFFSTQSQIITSQLTLRLVAEDLALDEQLETSIDEAVNTVKSSTKVTQNIGSDIVTLEVQAKDANLAFEICESIIKNYGLRRIQLQRDKIQAQLESLKIETEQQQETVNRRKLERDEIMRHHELVRSGTSGDVTIRSSYANRELIQRQISELEKQKTSLSSAVITMQGRENKDLVEFASTIQIPGNLVVSLYPKWLEDEKSLTALRNQGLGLNHPKIKSIQSLQKISWDNIMNAIDDLKVSTTDTLITIDNQIADLTKRSENQLDEAVDSSIAYTLYEEAQNNLSRAQSLLQEMKIKSQTYRIDLELAKFPFEIHQEPSANYGHIFPKFNLFLIIGAVVGLILGVATAVTLEVTDPSVNTIEDVEDNIQSKVMAVVPTGVSLLYNQAQSSRDSEAYSILRTNLQFKQKDPSKNSYCVTSGTASEGKSTTLCNIATIFAQAGNKTIIIDADLRRPSVHKKLELQNQIGLSNILQQKLSSRDVVIPTKIDNLYCLPVGSAIVDPAIILSSPAMKTLIAKLKEEFDYVFIDSPPIIGLSDGSTISSLADQTLAVVQHKKLPKQMLSKITENVQNAGGHLVGVILNNVDIKADAQYEYYTSYYTYYANEVDNSVEEKDSIAPSIKMDDLNIDKESIY